MHRLLILCSMFVLAALGAPAAGAQETSARFEIVGVGDTTFLFRAGDGSWVRSGQRGIAVDPRRRDVMVARFHVLSLRDGIATAKITGQTTNITTEYVAVMSPPVPSWYRRSTFWIGAAVGTVVGVIVGAAT